MTGGEKRERQDFPTSNNNNINNNSNRIRKTT